MAMESSRNSDIEQQPTAGKRVTIVQYDLTSSEDERCEDESFIYWSCKRSPVETFEPDCLVDQHDAEEVAVVDWPSSQEETTCSDHDHDDGPQSKRPRVTQSDTPSATSSDEYLSDHVAVAEATEMPQQEQAIAISSSDSEPAQPVAAPSKKPYALRMKDLPSQLQQFLNETRSFFTRPHSLERHGNSVADSTYTKAEERLLCFLGHVQRRGQQLTPADFNSAHLIESYLDFLKEQRGLSSATISNHASSLLYPLKFLYRNKAPKFEDVPIISQIRRMATVLQKQGDVERTTSREDLQALNKWLDWDEVLEATSLQRSRFEMARNRRQRAREAAELLLLSLYCHLPPSRGLEMRTLEIVHEAQLQGPFMPAHFRNRNVALLQKEGGITIYLQRYKTYLHAGKQTVPIQADSELCRLFTQFVNDFRGELYPGQSNDYLFLNANGQPYSSGSFTKHLKKLFERLTGSQVSINCLRSSFLTWAYSQRQCNDSMKDSLAAALRHSREQAQSTYDRRTANERMSAALELARRKAEQASADGEVPGTSNQPTGPEFTVGQFVGLVADESTLQKPSIFLGRIQAFLPDNQVSLLWYKNVGGGIYSLELEGGQWIESKESLVPVKVAAAKGRTHAHRLLTSLRTIHKAVLDGRRES